MKKISILTIIATFILLMTTPVHALDYSGEAGLSYIWISPENINYLVDEYNTELEDAQTTGASITLMDGFSNSALVNHSVGMPIDEVIHLDISHESFNIVNSGGFHDTKTLIDEDELKVVGVETEERELTLSLRNISANINYLVSSNLEISAGLGYYIGRLVDNYNYLYEHNITEIEEIAGEEVTFRSNEVIDSDIQRDTYQIGGSIGSHIGANYMIQPAEDTIFYLGGGFRFATLDIETENETVSEDLSGPVIRIGIRALF